MKRYKQGFIPHDDFRGAERQIIIIMDESMRAKIALILATVTLVVGYFKIFLRGKSKKQKFIEKAKAEGNYTTGKCVDSKRIRGNKDSSTVEYRYDSYNVKYEYSVNGIIYSKKMIFQSPGMVGVRYPYEVTVYYNPKKPQKGICKEEAGKGEQRTAGCFGTIVITILVFEVVYNLLKLV